ncbi:MAG TPA: membrane dipeptidase [Longimicrobiales bacterium]|nr:membrane dipeptidase [Longimicrobiales bacterium]
MSIDRRTFVRLAAAAALAPGPLAAAHRSRLRDGAPGVASPGPRRWPGYADALVVDALGSPGAFNVPDAVEGGLAAAALASARRSGITAINVTVGVVGEVPDPFEESVKDLARWEREIDRHPEVLARVRRVADIRRAKQGGQVGLVYGFQDTVALGADLERMDAFHALGVRVVQLTYNGRNRVGDGSLEPGNAGLSRFGIELIERMNELGVLIDLSHCGQRTTAEGIERSARPVAITHTGCRAVFDHPRNKRDEELRACAERGGVVGIYLMPYLNASGPPSAEDVMRHVDHALRACGEDHVGIWSDQSIHPIAATPEYYRRVEQEVERRRALGISAPREDTAPFVPDLNDARRMELIADLMSARGHPDRVIEKVLGANFVRLFGEVWG